MRVLVLGNDTPLGYSISAFASPLRRHELIGISIEKTRWGRERKVRRVVKDVAPDIVLDTRIVTQIDSSDRIGQRDVQRTVWLAEACERIGASYFYLSSAFVFSGQMTRPYLESDTPDVTSGLGRAPTRTLLLCLFVLLTGLVAMSLGGFIGTLLGLLLFFTGFTALEATLPSLASIYAPAASRGTAMGVFASSQFIGVFFGGMLGGALLDQAGVMGVWLGMSVLTLVWATVLGVSHLASPDSVKVA